MNSTKEMIEVMQAYVDGKKIECAKKSYMGEWLDDYDPNWSWEYYDYRIKPQKTKRLLTPMELFERGATHVKNECSDIYVISNFYDKSIVFNNSCYYLISISHSCQWTSDHKTWNSFEVEE